MNHLELISLVSNSLPQSTPYAVLASLYSGSDFGTSTESEASKKRIETEKSLKYIKQKPKTLFKKKKNTMIQHE
jgi:hypothetical protein